METDEKTIKHHVLLSRAIKVFDVPDRVMIKDSELIFKKNGGGRGQYKSFIKKNGFSDLSFDKLLFIFSFFFYLSACQKAGTLLEGFVVIKYLWDIRFLTVSAQHCHGRSVFRCCF